MGERAKRNVGAVGTNANSNDVGVELGDKVGESDVEEGDREGRGFLRGERGAKATRSDREDCELLRGAESSFWNS